ncbi:ABC transporter ATP-binding protein [Roseburia sp. MSJ-14]|uniref:ABC transporter ATP-binding protein n=1 Tax=Roseburia sp. MSJ-14 TaxID=2841514 RepID=UPI001C0FFDA1|nr:ABC transporter ATP-binding protein/permease [Roseburia sp. MSJ-14]
MKKLDEKTSKKSTISWLIEFAGEKKLHYILSVIFAVLGVLASLIPYIIMGTMISQLMKGNTEWSYYLNLMVVIIIAWVCRVLLHAVSTTFSHVATFQVLGSMRKRVCEKLVRMPLGAIKDMQSGSLKNILVERIDSIETILAHIVPEFTANLMAPICLFIYMLRIDWRMALLSLVTIPLGMIAFMGMMSGNEENQKNAITKTKILNDTAVEYINGIEVIKAFGKSKSSYEKFVIAAKEGAACYINWMKRCNIYMSLSMAILPSTLVTVLPFGAMFVKNGSLMASDFIMLILLSMGLITPLITISTYMDDLNKMNLIVSEVTNILEAKELDRPEKTVKRPESFDITLQDVRFAYKEKEVLHGINMEIPEAKVTAFVGPSGSGKSTVAKLIASLWDIAEGQIKIGGVDIKNIATEDYNRMIAYVSQDNYLFNETVMDNIRMGNLNATDEQVIEVAKASGCHEFIEGLENGYHTIVGDGGGHLSGGERQRISIARAMLKNAPIIILDEATAYTDPENEAIIQDSVAKLVQGKTLIVIAHRLSTIMDSDKIYVIKNGKVDSMGTHEQLLAQNGLYASMWNAHIAVKDEKEEGGSENV